MTSLYSHDIILLLFYSGSSFRIIRKKLVTGDWSQSTNIATCIHLDFSRYQVSSGTIWYVLLKPLSHIPLITFWFWNEINFSQLSETVVKYSSWKHTTKTYNFDPHKLHFYIVKLGFTGVYIIFLIFALKHRLWVLIRTASPRQL